MAAPSSKPERPAGPSMLSFWEEVLEPALTALAPERILEIGSDTGATTQALLAFAEPRGAVVHAIDPVPRFDVEALEEERPDSFVFHRALSLDVLPSLDPVDFALIDGDHNWHTVLNELILLERQAHAEERTPAVVALHDIGWPYARRDLYYDPETIPEDKRRPYEVRGIDPETDELSDDGLNPHLANATESAVKHSGVRGAIDDFREQSKIRWRLFEVPGEHGLGVLAPEVVLEEKGKLRDLLEATSTAAFLRARVEAVEQARIRTEVRRARASKAAANATEKLAAARERMAELELAIAQAPVREDADASDDDAIRAARRAVRELEDELDDAQRRARRLEKQRDALDEREAELDEQFAAERRRARRAEEELAAAEGQRERDRRRVAELEGQLEEAEAAVRNQMEELRAELEEAHVAARSQVQAVERRLAEREQELEQAAAARTRLVADYEDARESLERTLDDVRAEADTARHSAAELREMLEERELEMQRISAELSKLQAALGTARAETEIAEAERTALQRRLTELSELHETLLRDVESGLETRLVPASDAARVIPEPPDFEAAMSPEAVPATLEVEPSEVEREAIGAFTREYRPLTDEGFDPVGLPSARDRRGFLVGADAEREGEQPSVDVVIAVHNALDDVRRCLWSLVNKASYPFRLIVVNDGSDTETTAYLDELAAAEPTLTVIHNEEPPHGYTIAANLGMRAATGDYVVLLNSDTIVTYGWIERIVDCGESDDKIGILGPLSNAASHQSVPSLRDGGQWATNPLPPFTNVDGVAKLLERISPQLRPRFPFINGFCYVIRRAVLDENGYFDEENFASGFCEENDYSYRASQAGFELAIVDDGYVYHAKSKSYTPEGRAPIAKRNYQIFLEKHGREEINRLVKDMESDPALKPLRSAVSDALSSPRALAAAIDAGESGRLEIAFILPGLGAGGSGGSHSVYQEVRGLRELGLPARILLSTHAWDRARSAYDDATEIFETFGDVDELAEKTAGADVISATHFKSVAQLAELRRRRDDFLPAYYVQDYEPFFTSKDSADVREAIDSYTAVEDCLLFAKTHWLCNIVAERHGLYVAKVEPSIDEELFVPTPTPRTDGPLRIVAMIRPRTPRRQPTATVAVLEHVKHRFGEEVEVVTFGCGIEDMRRLTDSQALLDGHRGLLTRREVATMLARSDVFLDMSMYQAFGRTALEAMACGSTAVLPRLGGAWEFVVDGENAIAVDTLDPAASAEALADLAGDRDLVRRLQEGALETASRYSVPRAALSEYLVFSQAHAERFGRERAAA